MTETYIMYKIYCLDDNVKDIYIGSSKSFRQRKSGHKFNCNNECSNRYSLKLYDIIRNNGGWQNWNMVPIEEYKCDNLIQSKIREQYWIETLKPSLNCIYAYGINVEKKKQAEKRRNLKYNSKEETKEKRKEYINNNKEKIKEWKKQYYQNKKLQLVTISDVE
jgi:hypothetical protein